MAKILIIDDDPKIGLFFTRLAVQMEHESHAVETLKEGLASAEKGHFDLVLLDLEFPEGNGLQILPDLLKLPSNPEVIIITGAGNASGAKLAFKYGAWDYVQKPFLIEEVSLPITRALQYRREKQETLSPLPLIRSGIIGESDVLQSCLKEVARASATDASVLITGETGTGKELFAGAIHKNSRRASMPFIAVDCGALPDTLVESTLLGHEKGAFTGADKKQDGLIKQANGGTLMLDEVGDLPLNVQKSLLRTLQERSVRPIGGKTEIPIDFRLVAATNRDLDIMVMENRFREDLLYRIRAIGIKLPPLRDRGEDIKEITIKKVHDLSQRYQMEAKGISSDFIETLGMHPWPGNVRELINVLEYALASAGQDSQLIPKHLPPELRTAQLDFPSTGDQKNHKKQIEALGEGDEFPTLTMYREQTEKDYLKMLLNKSNGDRDKASLFSGISQSRLYGLLKKHHLSGFK